MRYKEKGREKERNHKGWIEQNPSYIRPQVLSIDLPLASKRITKKFVPLPDIP